MRARLSFASQCWVRTQVVRFLCLLRPYNSVASRVLMASAHSCSRENDSAMVSRFTESFFVLPDETRCSLASQVGSKDLPAGCAMFPLRLPSMSLEV